MNERYYVTYGININQQALKLLKTQVLNYINELNYESISTIRVFYNDIYINNRVMLVW